MQTRQLAQGSITAFYEADFDVDALVHVELNDHNGDLERVTHAIGAGEEVRQKLQSTQPDWFRPEPVGDRGSTVLTGSAA